ncbi:MAG: alpha-amylase family glycosyl hydrolase, partial [Halanaerobacter sp.]
MGLMLNVKNRLKLLTVLLIFILLLSGCTNTRNEEEEFKTSTASLNVTVYLDNIITNNSSSSLAVEDQIDLSNVEITLTNTDNPNLVEDDDQDVSADAVETSFNFDDLNLDDTYEIEVKVKDDEGDYVYQGSDEVVVSNVNANYSLDELTFLKTKNVVVSLSNLPSDVDGGQVSLVTANVEKEAEVEVDGNTAEADFGEQSIEVGEYDLNLSLTAGKTEVFNDTKSEILVLPNQVTKINLDCKDGQGGLGISVLWESPPQTPNKFSAQVLGETNVRLNWSAGDVKYNLYRSQNKDFAQANQIATEIEDSKYVDQDIEDDQDYYYWVEAVSKSGISSDKNGPRKVSIPKFSGIKVHYYTTKEKEPTIVVGTQNGKKITQEMGYSKEEPAKMKTAADAPKNWYSFKIADKYLPQNEVPLVVRFAGAEKGVSLSPVETAWYDGSKWNSERPTKIEESEDENIIKSQNQGAIWENRTAYYLLIDRFYNANSENDNSYDHPQVDKTGSKVETFHGGDIAGVTQKIKEGYFKKLGINTICISAPYEQIHGSFARDENEEAVHYAYDGYYALDYTTIDKNVGTIAEFREFVTTAHKHDLRVVMDV